MAAMHALLLPCSILATINIMLFLVVQPFLLPTTPLVLMYLPQRHLVLDLTPSCNPPPLWPTCCSGSLSICSTHFCFVANSWPTPLPPPQPPLLQQLEALNISGQSEQPKWFMGTGASSHLTSDTSILNSILNSRTSFPNHVIVDNGSTLPIIASGNASLPHRSLHMSDTLVAPSIFKNLASVCQFTRYNSCSVEFDRYDFSVKD